MVHRDLKPENIFITNFNKLKIGDYGYAKQLSYDNISENSDLPANYCAPPEQKKNVTSKVNKVDVWVVGYITYMMTFGFTR